ncbi:MAG: LysR family transcriptional regulator [Rhodospirillaceae bacterium]|nr:LysR family transcriptional regulator [Rhodospirillaceae bacterium]
MDLEQVRTFLEVLETGSFIRAADQLNVTQSTVSARIKELELKLGQTLFVRRKSGATLTPAGKRFQPHAQAFMHILRQARQDVALPADVKSVLNIGGQFSLWERILLDWMGDFRAAQPTIAMRAEVGTPDSLMSSLGNGLLDFAVLYSPEARAGYRIEKLMDETLVMVATRADHKGPSDGDYIQVDWGHDFATWHSDQFPGQDAPGVNVSLGALGLRYIQSRGGAGYFPEKVVADAVAAGQLFPVAGMPQFLRPAHVIYPADSASDVLSTALASLRKAAKDKPKK